MYVLLFLQFTSSTFYDPARRALEPKLVPKKQLHLATTLDTFAWSVTVAVGSSLGGAVVSKLGTTMCFCTGQLHLLVRSPMRVAIAGAASMHMQHVMHLMKWSMLF